MKTIRPRKAPLRHAMLLALLLLALPLRAAEFYVAPGGNDANPGTLDKPFATVAKGQEAASPGDTVWLRGGEYKFTGTTTVVGTLLDKSGEEGKPINYFAYKDEVPAFDFFEMKTMQRMKGFSVTASWIHLRGIEVRGIRQTLVNAHESWAIRLDPPERGKPAPSHNIFERLNLHNNQGPGLFIAAGGDNLVLNCDSHHNYDEPARGENADGFGGHSSMDGNVFRGCRAWFNSDDGYDLIHALGQHTIENCWAWSNGFKPDSDEPAGNGGGFKCGGWLLNPAAFPGDIPVMIIRGNLAFNNRRQGFNSNYQPMMIRFYNNTAFNNPAQFELHVAPRFEKPVTYVLRNNIALGSTPPMSDTTKNPPDDQYNSWNEGFSVSADDFESIVPEGVDGPRGPDGSLPKIKFMHLKPGSKLIDAGIDVRLPFNGRAPDLGAFETE